MRKRYVARVTNGKLEIVPLPPGDITPRVVKGCFVMLGTVPDVIPTPHFEPDEPDTPHVVER